MSHFSAELTLCVPIAIATSLSLTTFRAAAITTNWNTNSSGSFTNASNWNNGVPDSDDTAVFNRGFLAYEVSFPGGSVFEPPPNYVIDFLRVRTNEVSFVYNAPPFNEALPMMTVGNPGDSIIVGESTAGAILNMAISRLSGANATIGSAPGGTGTLNVGSGTFQMSGNIKVADRGTGTMTIFNGGSATSATGQIGFDAFSNGTVTVTGAGSTWTNSSYLRVGDIGTGTLTIQDGGSVSSVNGYIGLEALSNGSAAVRGAGSTWTIDGLFYVGSRGTGNLTIEAGGNVSSTLKSDIGVFAGSHGTATVSGPGSTWTNEGLDVGSSGTGTLTIEGGAAVSNVSSSFSSVGGGNGSTGVATVTGTGSTWMTGGLEVGLVGAGTLNIAAGGNVSSTLARVGPTVDFIVSQGQDMVTVDGPGSTWTIAGDLTIGRSFFYTPEGTVTVSNGGTVSVDGTLLVNASGRLAGNGVITADVENSGEVRPGLNPGSVTGVTTGALHIDGSYVQLSALATLGIRLGGTTPGIQFDQLQVNGPVTLSGVLRIDLANAFLPTAGNAFDILDWTSLSGTFSLVQLPGLSSGLAWDTSQLYTTGRLSVISTGLPGDYNGNGVVDAADYVLWRNGGPLLNDGTPGVQSGDYDVWRAHFGQTASSGSGAGTNAAVPEPATLMLMSLAAACGYLRRRRAA